MKIKIINKSKEVATPRVPDEAEKQMLEIKKLLRRQINDADTFVSSRLPEIKETHDNALKEIKNIGEKLQNSKKGSV